MRKQNKKRFRRIDTLETNSKRLTVRDLKPGKSYTFRVRALSGELMSDFSNELTVTTPSETTLSLSPSKREVSKIIEFSSATPSGISQ